MIRYLILLLPLFVFGETCDLNDTLGVFPEIDGMGCDSYALMIGLTAGVSAYLFWEQVTK